MFGQLIREHIWLLPVIGGLIAGLCSLLMTGLGNRMVLGTWRVVPAWKRLGLPKGTEVTYLMIPEDFPKTVINGVVPVRIHLLDGTPADVYPKRTGYPTIYHRVG